MAVSDEQARHAADKSTFYHLVRGSWEATKGERPRFFSFILLYVVAYTLDLTAPWAIGYTLGVFVQAGFNDESLRQGMWGIAGYTLLKILNNICHHCARYLQNTVTYHARMYVLTDVFSQLMHFPLKWHIKTHSGENLSKLHRSAGAIESMLGTYVWQVVDGLVKVIGAGACLIALDFRVALNVLLFSALTILIMVFFNKRLRQKIRQNNAFANKISSICIDYLFNIVTVKTLTLEDSAIRYLHEQRDVGLSASKAISKYMELKWSTTGFGYALVIGSSLALYFYGHRGITGAFDVAEVYVLLNYLDRVYQAIGSFTAYYGGIIEAATAYEDAIAIREKGESVSEIPLAKSIPVNPGWSRVSLRNLDFSYEAGEVRGLNAVAFDLKRGEKVALVGPSGGGKSTILKIMAGLLEGDRCEFSTDLQSGLSINQLTPLCLLVPQEPEIFSESVIYNLTMGEEIETAKVDQMINLCRIRELMGKLPHGVNTILVEKGLNLSVGEKQRIALARGLLRAAQRPILLLDEPTSSLDPSTERRIFEQLLSHFNDRTVLTACHRLALIPLFDRIIYVAQGSIAESGTFDELITRQGMFYRAWEEYEKHRGREEQTTEGVVAELSIEQIRS